MLSNQKKNYLIVISIGVVISLAFLYLSLQNLFGTEESLHKASTEHLYGVPRFNGYPHGGIDDNRTAFVFGATGIYATSELFKCMSAIESLTKIGGWKGAVYLLMDKDTCLNRKLLKSFNNKNIRIVPVMKERRRQRRSRRKLLRTVTGHNLTDFVAINNTLNGRRLMNTQPFERSMAVKMHILDYLPSHIEYAVWYDCDVLFIRPNCVEQMMTNKPEITKERPIFLSLPGHVGSFVVKTDVSRDALDQWHTQILASNSPSALGDRPAIPDYKVFINLFGDNVTDPSSKFGLLHNVWKDSMPKGFTANHSVTWDTTECVVHLSNGRCRHLGPNNIDEFVKNLHLRSYGDRKWCPSVVRRKFKTYGIEWPFCWNPPLFWDA